MAGGDRLTLDIDLAAGSQVLLTSPGAAKWLSLIHISEPTRRTQ
ncbi:urease accessory protein UreD [Aquitalea sp. ASV11]|nr:urease accessory protein UreD [Aquitalea sp. ASV11]